MSDAETSLSRARRVDAACDRFEAQWRAGGQPRVEDYVAAVDETEREPLRAALLAVEAELVQSGSQSATETSEHRANGTAEMPRPEEAIPRAIGRFEVRGLLGQGAFGRVFRAHDPRLGREVAIKAPLAGALQTPQERERFLREAKSAAGIHHPNICAVHEIGEENGVPYIVMAYIPGRSLAAVMKDKAGPPPRQTAAIIRKLAIALDAAHQRGIVHRDLKPANVMIDQRTRDLVVMDFGLARGPRLPDAASTQSGMVLGTPAYMSPEQARGDSSAIGPAADIYSLGVILYELLAGRRPFAGTATEVIGQILHVDPAPPSAVRPGVDRRLQAACLKAMAKDPAGRYASMKEFAAAMDDVLRTPEPLPPRRKTPARVLVGLAAVALIVLVSVIFFTRTSTDGPQSAMKDDTPAERTPGLLKNPPEPAPESPPEKLPAKPPADAERIAADWILAHHGKFVLEGGGGFWHEKATTLPEPPYRLSHVNLSNTLVDDADLAKLRLPALIDVRLNRTGLTDRGMVEIGKLTGLITFEAGATPIGDDGVGRLAGLKSLEWLDIGATQISDRAAAAIGELKSLQTLSLYETRLTDRALPALEKLSNLKRLDLRDTQVTSQGVERLQDVLPFTKIDVSDSARPLTEDEGNRRAAEWFRGFGGAMGFRVGDKAIPPPNPIPDGPFRINFFTFGPGDALTDKGMIENIRGVHEVEFWDTNNTKIDGTGFACFKKNRKRVGFELFGCPLTDDGLKAIGQIPKLEALFMDSPLVTDAGLAHLAGHPEMSRVTWSCPKITDAGMAHVKDMVGVYNLVLGSRHIGDATLEMLAGWKQLGLLDLPNSKVTDEGMKHVAKYPNLRHLKLPGTAIGDAGLDALQGAPKLELLNIQNTTVTDAGVERFKKAHPKCEVNR